MPFFPSKQDKLIQKWQINSNISVDNTENSWVHRFVTDQQQQKNISKVRKFTLSAGGKQHLLC